MSNETEGHKKTKMLIASKLKEWFDVALTEYAADGRKLDAYSVSSNGVKIMAEVIWTPSKTNVDRDNILLLQSNAKVKILIVSPEIFNNDALMRQLDNSVCTERAKGTIVIDPIDASKLITDSNYVDTELKTNVMNALASAKLPDNKAEKAALVKMEDSEKGLVENLNGETDQDGIVIRRVKDATVRNIKLKLTGSGTTGIKIEG